MVTEIHSESFPSYHSLLIRQYLRHFQQFTEHYSTIRSGDFKIQCKGWVVFCVDTDTYFSRGRTFSSFIPVDYIHLVPFQVKEYRLRRTIFASTDIKMFGKEIVEYTSRPEVMCVSIFPITSLLILRGFTNAYLKMSYTGLENKMVGVEEGWNQKGLNHLLWWKVKVRLIFSDRN